MTAPLRMAFEVACPPEHEWGEVTVWQPPVRLGYLWYLGRDRADATEVEIRFLAQGAAATKIEIELAAQGDWVPLGAADEQKPAPDGTVEAWGRSPDNPVGGWYGLRKGYRGRFGMYLPPLLEALGLAELTHDARNNRMRAL
jgi:hypothetical protein